MSDGSRKNETIDASFGDVLKDCHERSMALFADVASMEEFASRQGEKLPVFALLVPTVKLARSFSYQAFQFLRKLSEAVAHSELSDQPLSGDEVVGSPCCPPWSLAAASWSWMRSPDDADLFVQPSVVGSDGTLLPLLQCPFCSSPAPQQMRADEFGRSPYALVPGSVERVGAVSSSLHVPEGAVDEDDEDTVAVPDA